MTQPPRCHCGCIRGQCLRITTQCPPQRTRLDTFADWLLWGVIGCIAAGYGLSKLCATTYCGGPVF